MKRITIIGLVALVAGLAALVTPGAAQAAGWQYWQLDGDRCWDATTLDGNGNGYAEVTWYDMDNDCDWDTKVWNTLGSDAFAEAMTYDAHEDGHWDVWLVDTDQRVGHEIAYFDDNGDGYYDRWAYVPRSAPDLSLRTHLAQVGSTVGGRATYNTGFGLINVMADFTGGVAYAAADYDNDGCPDHMDRNNYRRGCG
jgi:hypothetical protein